MVELLMLVVSVVASAVIGSFVFWRSPTRRLNQMYGLLTFCFIVISVANYFTLSVSDLTLTAIRIVISATTIAVLALYFLVIMLRPNHTRLFDNKLHLPLVFITIIIALLDLTPFVFSELNEVGGMPSPVPSTAAALFLIHFVGLIIASTAVVVTGVRSNQGVVRTQYTYLLLGILPIFFLAPLTGFVLPILLHRPEYVIFTPFYLTFFVLMIAYAIVRHRLFDVRLAAVRSAAYGLILLSLAGLYYFMAYIVSILLFSGKADMAMFSPINVILALVLAFLFQPLKRFFDRLTNSIFYRDAYDSDEFFAKLSSLLTSTIDLRGLIERASEEIAATFKSKQAFFFLYYTNGVHHHLSAGTAHHSRLPIQDAHILDSYIAEGRAGEGGIIVTEQMPDDSLVRRMLVSHDIALVMPLQQAKEVVGYVCLGEQQGRGYSKRDLKVLTTIADELVIAIQNALSLHEIKEINATLQQSIDNATKELRSSNAQLRHLDEVKDEFMSMASHQLRTPLTSVKGYISMVLEGDAGKITPQQRHLLTEAFNSSERMVRLIADFLNVSRLQTGKFIIEKTTIDLSKVIKDEVDSLQLIATTHDMKLEYKAPKSIPVMAVDEAKIRQVIMNFIDNAIYYSRPKSTIKIRLEEVEGQVAFTVIDTGIGVPVEEQARLFGKFFRAKNARKQRPDGTGVGLYLAKKVVTAHGGKMVFSSIENKGSTFGFRIPIRQN